MEKEGHRCTSIRGDMDHELRDKVVGEFRAGTTKILISTDVLSRGFDVTQARKAPSALRYCIGSPCE
jgi:ATP-dependent RNA helicase DDX19/DBP5